MPSASTICIFGDSIAHGVYDGSGLGWGDLLKRNFQRYDDDDGVLVYNLSISGERIGGVLGRFADECTTRGATVAIIAVGINDTKVLIETNEPRTKIADVQARMTEIIAFARLKNIRLVIVGLTSVVEQLAIYDNGSFRNDVIARYDAALREVAEREGVPFIGVRDVLTADDLPDGLHPHAVGQQKLYERIVAGLVEAGMIAT